MKNLSMGDDKNEELSPLGYLVHMYVGVSDAAERRLLRLVCMKYGITNWAALENFFLRKTRCSLRALLISVLRKQALAEYHGVKADIEEIRRHNIGLVHDRSGDYVMKKGILVNQRWEKSEEEFRQMRKKNQEMFGISEEAADEIEIMPHISIDHIRYLHERHCDSLLVYRAALRFAIAQRRRERNKDLGMEELHVSKRNVLDAGRPVSPLKSISNPSKFFF